VGWAVLAASNASACIPVPLEHIRQSSDVIVEGIFVIDSEKRGEAHIEATRTLKGARKKSYQVRWDPNVSPEDLPDCGLHMPASGAFESFSLFKEEGGTYRLTGRWQPAKKDR
jgi:hypothetical protein